MSNKPSLALVSTWNIKCGIAGYAESLAPVLSEYFEVKVFPLNQAILKSTESDLIKLGNRLIKDMANQISEYDYVNFQWEPGIYGSRPNLIYQRITWLISKAKTFSLTFHTIMEGSGMSKRNTILSIAKGIKSAINYRNAHLLNHIYHKLYRHLSDKYSTNCFLIYHTQSAKEYINLRYPNLNTLDHPLCFIDKQSKIAYSKSTKTDRDWLVKKYNLSEDDIIVSTFGFISKYKGFDTVIKSIKSLPPQFRLLIFGALHPNELEKNRKSYKYLRALIDMVEDTETKDTQPKTEHNGHDQKVIFAGNLDKGEFERGINGSDINVFAYIEVGQTSSGPMALSLDLQKKTIATNNHCFNELKKYAVDCFDQFDIGNHYQLAKLIELSIEEESRKNHLSNYSSSYNIENRVEQLYRAYLMSANVL